MQAESGGPESGSSKKMIRGEVIEDSNTCKNEPELRSTEWVRTGVGDLWARDVTLGQWLVSSHIYCSSLSTPPPALFADSLSILPPAKVSPAFLAHSSFSDSPKLQDSKFAHGSSSLPHIQAQILLETHPCLLCTFAPTAWSPGPRCLPCSPLHAPAGSLTPCTHTYTIATSSTLNACAQLPSMSIYF